MRKLIGMKLVSLLAALGLVLGLCSAAQAGEMVPESSTLSIQFGGLPKVTVSATPGTGSLVVLGDGSLLGLSIGHNVGVQASAWSTINFGPGTSLFTGVPLISNLKVTVHNRNGIFQDGFTVAENIFSSQRLPMGPMMGGIMRLDGKTFLSAAGIPNIVAFNATHIGGLMGETTMGTLIGNNITATEGPWFTGAVRIQGVTSNLISIPDRANAVGVAFTLEPNTGTYPGDPNYESVMTFSTMGGYVSLSLGLAKENHTVTISGTKSLLSGSKEGMVTLISPLRIRLGAIAGTIPGRAVLKINFVPEPGTMLLLISGAVGLVVIGRRRLRK